MEEIPKKISAELDDEDEEVEEPRILYEGFVCVIFSICYDLLIN